jgi:hypothetical protein
MNAVLRRRLEMATRVRDFLRAHPSTGPEQAAVAHLEELLQRAEALAAQQRAGVVAARAATLQRAEVRRGLQTKLLRYLTAVGAVAAQEAPELAAQFKLPRRGASQQALLTAARGMLEEATAQKAVLVSRGMSEKLLEDLGAALTAFEQTLEASRTGRREHVGASADLQAVTAQITEQVRLLDGLVRYQFGDNPELMGAWASARNVLGPFKSKGESQTGGEGEKGGPAEVKPAA